MFNFKTYSHDILTALSFISPEEVATCVDILQRAKSQNSMVYIIGNGGSAATASHFANDLLKMASLRAVALPDLLPAMSAFANDDGWENMYARMLKKLLLPQDVVIGISCSGFSMNVVNAIEMARSINLPAVKTIVLTGSTWDTPLAALKPDVIVHVPFGDIRVQEDCHLIVCHAIAGAL